MQGGGSSYSSYRLPHHLSVQHRVPRPHPRRPRAPHPRVSPPRAPLPRDPASPPHSHSPCHY